jgi:hypothetical protein
VEEIKKKFMFVFCFSKKTEKGKKRVSLWK